MQLFLESSDLRETEKALKSGLLSGIITTPDLMQRYGAQDTDGLIVKLAKLSDLLHIDLLGTSADMWIPEAQRIIALGIDRTKIVFRLPTTLDGLTACRELVKQDILVGLHYVYTLQQAYFAMQSGASFVHLMVGELQEQGQEGYQLLAEVAALKEQYGYTSKLLFSQASSREHIRESLRLGVDALGCSNTLFERIKSDLLSNPGAQRLFEESHQRLNQVQDIMREENPHVYLSSSIQDAAVEMTKGGMGAVAVLDESGKIAGVFTDGDLRRQLQAKGSEMLQARMSDLSFKSPITIESHASLKEASELFKDKRVDNILVVQNGQLVGMLDIQDLNR